MRFHSLVMSRYFACFLITMPSSLITACNPVQDALNESVLSSDVGLILQLHSVPVSALFMDRSSPFEVSCLISPYKAVALFY